MADRGPVKVPDARVQALIDLYRKAYKDIVISIESATTAGRIQKARTMATIRSTLTSLGDDVDKWVKVEIPKAYLDGANIAIQDLRDLGADITGPKGLAPINREAIAALTDETSLSFAQGLTAVARNAQVILNEAARQQLNFVMADGFLKGESAKIVANNVKQQLKDQGISSITDRAGRNWTFDNYADMLVRTKIVEARNMGLANKMSQNGYDLVQVTNHRSDHAACAYWEGRILSVTGQTPGYPTLAEAKAGGLFHPRCQHAINTINLDLAKLTKAYDNSYNGNSQEPLSKSGGQRPLDKKQSQIENALNRNDVKGAQKVVDSISDPAVKAGMQSTIDAITGNQTQGRLFVNPLTQKISHIPPADDKLTVKTFYHGAGNSATPGKNNMFGDAFYVSRDEKTASIFGEVATKKIKIRESDILVIGSADEYKLLVDKAIAAYPNIAAAKAMPKYTQSLGFKAVEASPQFDELGGIAILDKALL